MKKAMIAASIVGAAAAGVILYLSNRSRSQQLLDEVSDSVDEGRRIAKNHLRKSKGKLNNIIHEHVN
jgi:hypothetical protein